MRVMFVALIAACQLPVVPLAAWQVRWQSTEVARTVDAWDPIVVSHQRMPGVRQQDARPEPSIARPMVFGALLGAGSWLAGGLLGYGLSNTDRCAGDSFCGFEAFLLGAAIGGSTGLVVGMHLGNNRRGSFRLGWLTSLGIWGAGIGIVLAMDNGGAGGGGQEVVLIAIPVAQFAFTLLVERATGRTRARRASGMRLAVLPRPDGGLGIGLSHSFW